MIKKTFAEELRELHLSMMRENNKGSDFNTLEERFQYVKEQANAVIKRHDEPLLSSFIHHTERWLYIFLIYKDHMVIVSNDKITTVNKRFLNPYETMVKNRMNMKK